jgi:hypothetical protein
MELLVAERDILRNSIKSANYNLKKSDEMPDDIKDKINRYYALSNKISYLKNHNKILQKKKDSTKHRVLTDEKRDAYREYARIYQKNFREQFKLLKGSLL